MELRESTYISFACFIILPSFGFVSNLKYAQHMAARILHDETSKAIINKSNAKDRLSTIVI